MSPVQATLEWENQEDGFLAKILVGDGSKDIPVGTPVAVITEEKDDVNLLYQLHTYNRCYMTFLHAQRKAGGRFYRSYLDSVFHACVFPLLK